jgi:hypothetical protein
MYDRRVSRGSTYAPSKRTQPLATNGPFRPIPIQQQQHAQMKQSHQQQQGGRANREQQHPLPPSSAAPADQGEVDFMRVATPEPVQGRVHMTIQTDTYLEDLRRNKHTQEHDFSTQTDPENDRPTQPLFIPRSSGDDVATEIEPDALFDFELEVQSILNVLNEKTLEQALMEVCEEEELAELAQHQASFQQEKNAQLIAVQQVIQRDERRKAERERRKKQEQERLEEEKRTHEKRLAATVAKRLVANMEEEILVKLEEQGYFYDPVRKEVEKIFMPHLLQQTTEKLAAYQVATEALDDVLNDALNTYAQQAEDRAAASDETQVELLIKHKLDPSSVPCPTQPIMSSVYRVGKEEERSARAGIHGKDSLLAVKNATQLPPPETRAQKIVDGILAERAAKAAEEAKRLHDIILIQSLQRAKRDRARVAKLAEKRRREAERAAMSPAELLASLRSVVGLQLKPFWPSEEDMAAGLSADVRVSKVEPTGSAAQAGLIVGDRILSVNGTELLGPEGLSNEVLKREEKHPGEVLLLSVKRLMTDGRTETIQLEIATDEEGYNQSSIRSLRAEAELSVSDHPWYDADSAKEALEKLPGKLGATVAEQKGGAKLAKVTEGSAAARAGLKEGDIIVSLNGSPISDHKVFTAACKELHAGDIVEVEILTPASQEKLASGVPINLRSMSTTNVAGSMI